MTEVVSHRVRKFTEILSDEDIRAAIQKYSMGAEIQWERIITEVTPALLNPETGQTITLTIPVTKIYLGMKGLLIGPEYYIWWAITLDAVPTKSQLEKYIMEGLEEMRQRKAKQAQTAN